MLPIQGPTVRAHDSAKRLPASDGPCPVWSHVRSCLVYLDDIIVFAKDFNTHLSRLAEVFERLKQAGLKLHGTKCSLFQRRVSFLGHVLSGDGIEVQAEKFKAVRDWPVPKNISELRSYLGMVSYYRKFIPEFANIAAPCIDFCGKAQCTCGDLSR